MLIDTLTAKLTADASGFTPVMERAGQQMRGFQAHGESANHGLTLVRRGFESLAIQATGVSGPVGRVSQGLLTLGAGSATVLGVTAGIGLIAGAITLLRKPMEDAKEAAKKFGDELMNTLANASRGAAIALQLKKVGEQIDELRDKIEHPGFVARAKETLFNLISSDKAGTADAQARIAKYTEAIAALNREFSILTGTMHKADTDLSTSTADTKLEDIADAFKVIQGNVDALVNDPNFQTFLQSIGVETNFGPTKMEQGFANMANFVKGGVERGAPLKAPGTSAEFLKHGFEPATDATEKELKERGAEIGAAFVMAIAQGAQNASEFLKQIMLQIANFAILKIFKTFLGIASPSRAGIELGQNFSLGLAMGVASGGTAVAGASGAVAARLTGSARLGLDLSGMPPAMNSLAAARDQDWQRLFRESSLVAQTAGFKFS